MSMMNIFRIENPTTNHGMWYDAAGVYNPFIESLSEGKSASLPMGWDKRYGARGRRWYSGTGDADMLKHWFSERDAVELGEAGYRLHVFEASEFIVEEFQVIFTREGVVASTVIPLSVIWPSAV